VFTVDDQPYRWDDVFQWARRRGDWGRMEAEVREGLACARLASSDFSAGGSTASSRAAAERFRRDRRLFAAEDLQAWLDARYLGLSAWRHWLERAALREQCADNLGELVARFPATTEEVDELIWATGVCGGWFARWAGEVAIRAAAFAAAGTPGPEPEDGMQDLEGGFGRFSAAAAASTAIEAAVEAGHLGWVTVSSVAARFPTEGAGREAVLCVHHDGSPLAEVATRAGAPVRDVRLLVEDAPLGWQALLASATEGEVIGPVEDGDAFVVLLVTAKVAPSPDDPEVAARARALVVERALRREVDDRVVWHEQL